MKTLDPTFKATLAAESATLVWCWLLTRADGTQMGFTSFDRAIAINGIAYDPGLSFNPGAAKSNSGLESNDSQELNSILSSDGITDEDLLAGKYDYAKISSFLVDPYNLPENLQTLPYKYMPLFDGIFGKVTLSDRGFKVDLRGREILLDTELGSTTSKFCRATLGDSRCTVDLTTYTHNLNIVSVSSNRLFVIDGGFQNRYFDYGKLTFTSGANTGFFADIGFYQNNEIVLFQEAPRTIFPGDTITAIRGCNKTLYSCITFNNALNFQGEPFIPQTDKMLKMPVER